MVEKINDLLATEIDLPEDPQLAETWYHVASWLLFAVQNPLYTKLPLPPVPTNSIRLIWNNTNALQIENEATLAKSIDNYLKHEPTLLGLIETKQNF
jgi:hypothetical protein